MEESREESIQTSEGPARRVATIARVGARYGFGFVFRRRFASARGVDLGRIGTRLRRSFEDLGPTYVELGRYLSGRRDLIPPDIAAELGRSSIRINPTPFAEVRALVERELRNDLYRLFEGFERSPVRVGTFTQSHRATLPGGRGALVVLSRPGVRRDLLAMRPVADLVRRRLANQLPLDPSEVVADFIAQANHRRDMHFAAQTARSLREIESLGMIVPNVYRSYSAGRCITLEAPESPGPTVDAHQAAEATIQLALREGIFFADLSPERFATDVEGSLWICDPTEVFSVDPERMRGLAEVFAAVRREDVEGLCRALRLGGSVVPQDSVALKRELRETLGSLGGPLWREHTLAATRDRGLEAIRRGGVSLPGEMVQMSASLVSAEDLGGVAENGDQSSIVAAAEAVSDLIERHRDPRRIAERTIRKVARPEAYAEYPRQLHSLLSELKDGEIEVRFRHGGLDELISKVDILANRLVFAALIAALIIGSSMIGTFVKGGIQVLGVSIFGFIGFVVAAVMGVMLLVGIIRSRRL